MAVQDPVVMPLARRMLECFDIEIQKVPTPPKYVQLRTGTVVDHLISMNQNECCEGLAWVRPMAFYPMGDTFPDQLPAPIQGALAGAKAWVVQLELGAVRCFPTPDATSIPTGDQWDAATQAVMDDAAAMRRALCCMVAWYQQTYRNTTRVLPGIWQPLATEGGCAGGILPVTLLGPACDCEDAGPVS